MGESAVTDVVVNVLMSEKLYQCAATEDVKIRDQRYVMNAV